MEVGKKKRDCNSAPVPATHFPCWKYFTPAYVNSSWCLQLQLANNLLLKKKKSSLNCCCRELDGWEHRKHRRLEKPSSVRRSCQGFFCSMSNFFFFVLLPELRHSFQDLLGCLWEQAVIMAFGIITHLSAQHGRSRARLRPACQEWQDPSRPCPEVLEGSCEGNKNKPKALFPLLQPPFLLLVTARRLISPCKQSCLD